MIIFAENLFVMSCVGLSVFCRSISVTTLYVFNLLALNNLKEDFVGSVLVCIIRMWLACRLGKFCFVLVYVDSSSQLVRLLVVAVIGLRQQRRR